ncbi:hypothetical protein [Caballeronia sp. dw_276]|uniref:hypothetical protein n=1 Tax=Caballeronia sp. dw_276 TaxID=2719795 RepID=UPI001BD26173|nr:hypothetical protein [Caballeronia sp. dw_276]
MHVYLWPELAQGTGLAIETVARLGASIDGNSSGFTAWRHDMTQQAASAAVRQGAASSEQSGDV